MCVQRGHLQLQNTRPGKFFLHVERPRPPPPGGGAAVLVLDGKRGNGHGDVARSAVAVRSHSEWVSARGCTSGSVAQNPSEYIHFIRSLPKGLRDFNSYSKII